MIATYLVVVDDSVRHRWHSVKSWRVEAEERCLFLPRLFIRLLPWYGNYVPQLSGSTG